MYIDYPDVLHPLNLFDRERDEGIELHMSEHIKVHSYDMQYLDQLDFDISIFPGKITFQNRTKMIFSLSKYSY